MNKGVTIKMWFKNGTYIEKNLEIKEKMSTKEAEQLISAISKVQNTVKESFIEDINAQVTIQGMTVRVSELIAFDFDFPEEKEEIGI